MHDMLLASIVEEIIKKKSILSESDKLFRDLIVKEKEVSSRFPGYARLYFRDEASPESKERADKYIRDREQLNSEWKAFYETYPGYELIISGDKQ